MNAVELADKLNEFLGSNIFSPSEIWGVVRSLQDGASGEGKTEWSEALRIISSAASMSLVPGNAMQPFQPVIQMAGSRSVLPEDFSENEIELIAALAPRINNRMLSARLHDIAWIRGVPRKPENALGAIDAYREIPLTDEIWIKGGGECWIRALALARLVRATAEDRLQEMRLCLFNAFLTSNVNSGYFALRIAEILRTSVRSLDEKGEVARHLRAIGTEIAAKKDFHRAEDYFEVAADWFKFAGDESSAAEMFVAVADQICADADQRISGSHPSYLASSALIEKAIHALRKISRALRPTYNIDQRIEGLRQRQSEEGQLALTEMTSISTKPVDVSEIVRQVENLVSGKSKVEALASLATFPTTNANKAKEEALLQIQSHPFSSMFGRSILGRTGHVVAKAPGFDISNPNSTANEPALQAEMVRMQTMLMGWRVQTMIVPAIEVIRREHQILLSDLVQLVERSPVVPSGRSHIIALGLKHGFDDDWASAIHILAPQLENLVRHHLNIAGVITTVMDPQGLVNEVGLSSLMAFPQVDEVLGADLSFEISSLFCNHFGPNMRNELAHGLLGDAEMYTAEAIYGWWLVFMLIKRAWMSVHDPK